MNRKTAIKTERRGDHPALPTGRLHALAEALATDATVEEIAASQGVTPETLRFWLNDSQLVFASFKHRQARIFGEGASLGLRVIVEMAEGKTLKTPAAVRFQAAKLLLELGGHSPGIASRLMAGQDSGGLHDMTEAQLRAEIDSARAVLEGSADDVTPADAPASPDPALLL